MSSAITINSVRKTGDTMTGPLLLPDGTAANPSGAFTSDADGSGTGFYRPAANSIGVVSNGLVPLQFNSTYLNVGRDTFIGWKDNPSAASGSTDILLGRAAAANPQWGVNSATPTAYTHNMAPSGVGTDIAGAKATIKPGVSTGSAVPALYAIQGGALGGSTGTTAQTMVDRAVFNASKVLTDNSAIAITNLALAANTAVSVQIKYAVEVFDGTDLQVETGIVSVVGVNKAGVFTMGTPTKFGNVQAVSAGTLTCTFAVSGANPAVISLNANSSLVPSAGYPRVTYTLDNFTQQAVAIQ